MSSSFDFGRAKQDLTEAVQNTRVREKAQGALVAHCYICTLRAAADREKVSVCTLSLAWRYAQLQGSDRRAALQRHGTNRSWGVIRFPRPTGTAAQSLERVPQGREVLAGELGPSTRAGSCTTTWRRRLTLLSCKGYHASSWRAKLVIAFCHLLSATALRRSRAAAGTLVSDSVARGAFLQAHRA